MTERKTGTGAEERGRRGRRGENACGGESMGDSGNVPSHRAIAFSDIAAQVLSSITGESAGETTHRYFLDVEKAKCDPRHDI